jgi:hypothetical protein
MEIVFLSACCFLWLIGFSLLAEFWFSEEEEVLVESFFYEDEEVVRENLFYAEEQL